MTSLYNRATPSQKRILRAVEGAVKNTADHHPDWGITPKIARSIAKRAAGTLSSQWGEVLAAREADSQPSDRGQGQRFTPGQPEAGLAANGRAQLRSPSERGASHSSRRSPLAFLHNSVKAMAMMARDPGQIERYEACVEILKMIAELQKKGKE